MRCESVDWDRILESARSGRPEDGGCPDEATRFFAYLVIGTRRRPPERVAVAYCEEHARSFLDRGSPFATRGKEIGRDEFLVERIMSS